jgi:membrane protease YdiL (CAAX protease family)
VRRWSTGRVAAWLLIVGDLATLNYASRFSGSSSSAANDRDALYHYSTAISGLVFYAVFFALVYAVAAVDTDALFALRRPRSAGGAVGWGLTAIIGVFVVSALASPLNAGKEQGLTPTHWEQGHAGAYAANVLVVAVVAPVVEELAFRGVGYGLLSQYGQVLAILVVGITFGLAHGLVDGLPILVTFGWLLALLRARTDSVVPGMFVHALFNAVALAVAGA